MRGILSRTDGVEVLMEEVTGVDARAREVVCGRRRVSYDTLVIAKGSQPSYFGHDAWAGAAPGLKTLEDAMTLRQRILGAFERVAVAQHDPAERDRLLTFVLVGGGPTGVEMAGSIAELAHDMLAREFRGPGGMRARVVLIEAGPRVPGHFAPDLSDWAARDLRGMGVEIRTGTEVTGIRRRAVHDTTPPMHVRNLAPHTQRWCLRQFSQFVRHFGKSPELLGPDDIRAYAGRARRRGGVRRDCPRDHQFAGAAPSVADLGPGSRDEPARPAADRHGRYSLLL